MKLLLTALLVIALALFLLTLSACTTTNLTKYNPDGKRVLTATNTSIGWDRENVTLDLLKAKDETALQIGIGKSGGSESFKTAIKKLEEALAIMKGGAGGGL